MNANRTSSFFRVAPALVSSFVLLQAAPSGRGAERPVAAPGSYELHPGLEMTLFAAEPDVVDPVALCFDPDGRVFVVEMRDYPYGFGAGRKPGGTIRLLEDTNGDGRADRSVVFAEGLSFPTSIAPWNGGVIVTAPPEVIFLLDTDGDGRADQREVLLKGFTLGVTDSNVNGLRWGLDNRLHGVNGGNGGRIRSTRKPDGEVPLRNFDFSFDPASGDFSPTYHTSGGFGLVFDDWGRSFVTYNINHLQQRIVPVRYLNRRSGLPPVEATISISDHGEMARIYPVSAPETRVNHPEQSGHFSSAGGMGYLGLAGYPGDLSGSVFVCDVVGNLVHRDLLRADGPIFVAQRPPAEQTSEFFASRDPAFRPVGLETGPDGALYLIDMQRDVIEHPDYIPDKVKQKLDLRAGQDRGRIYRIAPRGTAPAGRPRLSGATAAELVFLLGHSNQWWRTTAQRLLVERQDTQAVPALKKMAASRNPFARLHALWTLRGLRALNEALVETALADPHEGVRENAVLLAETFLPGSKTLQRALRARADDASARVRFQTALTLGRLPREDVAAALRRIFFKDEVHRWTRFAVLASLPRDEGGFLETLLSRSAGAKSPPSHAVEAVREAADLCGARATSNARAIENVFTLVQRQAVPEPVLLALFDGLHTGLARSGAKLEPGPSLRAALETISRRPSPALLAAAWKFSRAAGLPETPAQRARLGVAARRVGDPALPPEQRLEEIQLLALGDFSSAGGPLCSLLEVAQPASVQRAAVEALGPFKETAVATNLVRHWRTLAPAVRSPVIQILLQRVAFHEVLVGAIEDGSIKLGELNLDLEQRRRLLRESSPAVMARAAKFLGDEEYSNRKAVVEEWLSRLPAAGDVARGRLVFERACAQCHTMAGAGYQVGPDLGALAHRSAEDLLSNILDPNMAIQPNYVSYTAETAGGEIETGILQSETPETVVLLQAQGRKITLPRREIKRLESSGLSLMPDGLEAGMSPADLRDLIAFIQQRR